MDKIKLYYNEKLFIMVYMFPLQSKEYLFAKALGMVSGDYYQAKCAMLFGNRRIGIISSISTNKENFCALSKENGVDIGEMSDYKLLVEIDSDDEEAPVKLEEAIKPYSDAITEEQGKINEDYFDKKGKEAREMVKTEE